MPNITRFDPFRDTFEDMVRRFFSPVRWEAEGAPLEIKIDVSERAEDYTVKAELPGIRKEDINVQIDGNVVSISAEPKREKEEKEKGKVVRTERYHGALYRSFSLGHDIDEARATARYSDGVLELKLPKKATTTTKKLNVQ